jgi:hypothetical protein
MLDEVTEKRGGLSDAGRDAGSIGRVGAVFSVVFVHFLSPPVGGGVYRNTDAAVERVYDPALNHSTGLPRRGREKAPAFSFFSTE